MVLRAKDGVQALAELVAGRRVAVLTGAGCSTDSGIPDYRGPKTREKARNPIQYKQFVRDVEMRRRYWARSVVGWPRMAQAVPNVGHRALAALEAVGVVTGTITQNVDRLHHRAGSRAVVELHGALAEVVCLRCGVLEERQALQRRLLALNPGFEDRGFEIAPDGDAVLPEAVARSFVVADCLACGGFLKPRVVFFGENVPRPVLEQATSTYGQGEVLLVVGSSLTVFSGYRFVRWAKRDGRSVAIVNLGPTRGDGEADLRVDAPIGEVLPGLAEALGA